MGPSALVGFVALYGILGVIAARLFIRTARLGPDGADGPLGTSDPTDMDGGIPSDGVLSLAP